MPLHREFSIIVNVTMSNDDYNLVETKNSREKLIVVQFEPSSAPRVYPTALLPYLGFLKAKIFFNHLKIQDVKTNIRTHAKNKGTTPVRKVLSIFKKEY